MNSLERRIPVPVKHRLTQAVRRLPGTPAVSKGYGRYRMATAAMRMAPAFIVIGAQRAGTSSFYWSLARHPGIVPASRKEIHFFDREAHYHRGETWYRSQYPLRFDLQRLLRRGGAITGEATPAYLYRPCVPQRVAAMLPDVRLIVLLRDPVDRAYSNFQMSCRRGRDSGTFEQAIARELDHLAGRRITVASLEDYAVLPYLQRGIYVEQLKNWFRHFDRRQFLVLHSKDFYADPLQALYTTASTFLGLPDWRAGRYERHYKDAVQYPPLASSTRALLREFYRPYDEELYDLLGWRKLWN